MTISSNGSSPSPDRTYRLPVLPLDIIQLRSPLPPIRLYSPSVSIAIPLQHPEKLCCFRRYAPLDPGTQYTLTKCPAMSIGATFATLFSIFQHCLQTKHYKELLSPERRLYSAGIESILLPIGLFWFGFTAKPSIHWIVPTLAIGCSTIGIYSIYLAVYNYLADTYGKYTSSALAAQSFCEFQS